MSRVAEETFLNTPRLKSSTDSGFIATGETCGQYKNIEVEIGPKLGGGQQGTLFFATIYFELDGQEQTVYCAAKRINSKIASEIPEEMKIHGRISDAVNQPSAQSGLLRMIGTYQDTDGQTYALLPLCDATLASSMDIIKALATTNERLHNQLMYDLFSSMVSGLTHLSTLGLVHGDIKPDNIGLRKMTTAVGPHATVDTYRYCMLDFGSVIQPEDALICSPLYMSPDLVAKNKTTFESDVWAVGAVLRKLNGESIANEQLDPTQLIFQRGNEYLKARNAALLSDEENLQTAILDAIQTATSFSEGLAHIRTAMSETLPEKRPSIETLQSAQKKLASLLPELTARETSKLNSYLVNGLPAPKATLLETAQAKKAVELGDTFDISNESTVIKISTNPESATFGGGSTPQTVAGKNPAAFFSPVARDTHDKTTPEKSFSQH